MIKIKIFGGEVGFQLGQRLQIGKRYFLLLNLSALGSEIINGKKVPANSMLYMASVQDSSGRHICGGFLINRRLGGHRCSLKPTSVVLGTHNLKKIDNGTNRYSLETCEHPSYVNVESGNDIMLLKVSFKSSDWLPPVDKLWSDI
uniref:Peptidase S1 domain-containing protein n=1 Tax=Mola mola TaxID=94237 RepID=A0A3Q4AA61_MOLML